MKDASDSVIYKEFEIRAFPEELANADDCWSINIYITSRKGGEIYERNFYKSTCYKTRKVAVQECHIYAREIIDGKVEGSKV